MSDNYCVKCGAYAMYPVPYDGKPYCPKCYGTLNVKERIGTVYRDDETGEYVMPPDFAGDKEIRWPADDKTAVNVPLAIQKKLLHSSFYDTIEWMKEMLDDEDFLEDLEKMCEVRLEQGHARYGSTMYGWDSETRLRNIMEEFADIPVYKSSE